MEVHDFASQFSKGGENVIVAVGSDHGGVSLKKFVINVVKSLGHRVHDVGTWGKAPVDYPDYAEKIARMIQKGKAKRGILICGSGVGASVAANKFPGIRAGLCHDSYSARQGVEHDDVNVLCLGARIIGSELARDLVQFFMRARFSNAARHRRRLNKVKEFEKGKSRSV